MPSESLNLPDQAPDSFRHCNLPLFFDLFLMYSLLGAGDEPSLLVVKKTRYFCAIYIYNASFYQDRLGTNIGKPLKKREMRFLREVPKQHRDGTYAVCVYYAFAIIRST
jgi:hypothetical protein